MRTGVPHRHARLIVLVSLGAVLSATASAHADSSAPVILALAIIMFAAKLGGDLASRLGQPAVLGELGAGLLLGNLSLVGVTSLGWMATDPSLDMLAKVGVIILLFEAGLESTVAQMLKVGLSALAVAVIGVATPFLLGWAASAWLLPAASWLAHLFIGATLTATSVGITARVLKDLDASESAEARVILGAAVIDDVLGLVILAVVTGLIAASASGSQLAVSSIVLTFVKALAFLMGALVLGRWVSKRLFAIATLLKARMVLLAFGLGFCFLLAWLSSLLELAPIVGAFAAGLILEDVHYAELSSKEQHTLDELVQPISYFLVPIFFVLMGMRTQLASFARPGIVVLTLGLVVVAVIGKLAAGLGARGADRLLVGIGMIPRGEVGLIFAATGAQLRLNGAPVIDDALMSALIAMVMLTTMLTPPLLSWRLRRVSASQQVAERS